MPSKCYFNMTWMASALLVTCQRWRSNRLNRYLQQPHTTCKHHGSVIYSQSATVRQCYRRQAIATEQGKIRPRPSVTLYSLDRSLPNLALLISFGRKMVRIRNRNYCVISTCVTRMCQTISHFPLTLSRIESYDQFQSSLVLTKTCRWVRLGVLALHCATTLQCLVLLILSYLKLRVILFIALSKSFASNSIYTGCVLCLMTV